MLVYRAQLGEQAAGVAAVSARSCPCRESRLIGGAGPVAVQVTLRYVAPSGEIRTHRGRLYAYLEADSLLQLTGYQLCGTEVSLSFEPVRRRPGNGVPLAAADRFTLPFGLTAWGVTRVEGVEVACHAACRGRDSSLQVRGSLRLLLQTAATTLRLRIPFCRGLATSRPIDARLRWHALGGVAGLRLMVGEGGRIEGEVTLGYRLEGRPEPAAPPQCPLHAVRAIEGKVSSVQAVTLGAGRLLVEGEAAVDLYWLDRTGASRWTGRSVPFSALLAAPGVVEGDQLEATATLERVSHRTGQGLVTAHLLVAVTVTALRPTLAAMAGGTFRLPQLVAVAHGTAEADAPVLGEPVAAQPAVERLERLVKPGVSGDRWQVLLTPTDGEGRWRVGVHTAEGEAVPPAREVSGWAEDATVLPDLAAVGAEAVKLHVTLSRGRPADHLSLQPAAESIEASVPLPGPIRRVLSLALAAAKGGGLQVEALLQREGGGLLWWSAPVVTSGAPLSGRPVRVTAMPELHGDQHRLRLFVALAYCGEI